MNLAHLLAGWLKKINNRLETRICAPAYAGWMLTALALFYFAAGTNTMAGWLYVISGVSLAILAVAATLPVRSLRSLQVRRHSVEPVSAGDCLTVEVEIENISDETKTLLEVADILPAVLSRPTKAVIESIPPQSKYLWVYYPETKRRGIYRWEEIQLRTGTPLGLFWCRRSRFAKACAVVYPTVLSLNICPIIDEIGRQQSAQIRSERRSQMATEGITRTLRPYRFGDPTRLIHWRSSARYGELRVRELELATGGQEIIICLDTAGVWKFDDFEQAVIAAASLFFYASRSQLQVKLWTATTGLVQCHQTALQTLAATTSQEEKTGGEPPEQPLIWLTQNRQSLNSLPTGSRWILWPQEDIQKEDKMPANYNLNGFEIQPEQPLELQLQQTLK
ncbi:DUF58 domain-containing protein [Ancylothrix sp. C2]|uniref:DUF58 domain-containing protein n=1 Tax=Ancylothrix sp. D3o TaxID=2953691 RepID=UPI0021BAA3AD|nr:DUF58 domain-containing protein [Ancylothrix sp. D3o]MCT7950520.1 DUF58 domain-containing protein [Ancylothrix sp. D3o]